MIRSERATLVIRVAFSAAAAVLILAGASLNTSGRSGGEVVVAAIAGFMAIVAGAAYSEWTIAGPMAAGSLLVVLLSSHFNLSSSELPAQLAGIVLLALGGFVGVTAYRSFTDALAVRRQELDDLSGQLEDKQRAFLAATQDAEGSSTPADAAGLTAVLAHNLRAAFACCYLVSPDGTRFVPQAPGIGLERLHPQPVARGGEKSGPLISTVDAGREFITAEKSALLELVSYVPEEIQVDAILAVPLPIGNQVSGFVLLGNKPGGFTDDDRRLALTLARRAGAQLVTAHAVAMTQVESARHNEMSEFVKEASGKSTDQVLALMLERAQRVIRFDSGRVLVFDSATPSSGVLARVRAGEVVVRNRALATDDIHSGVKPVGASRTVHEALGPMRSPSGVSGALALGRAGSTPFTARDAETLKELGSMAGVAVENSRMLQAMTGQATKLDTALDALAEIAQALTSITEGTRVNEQKTLEAAVRVTGASAALLTRRTDAQTQRVVLSLGFPEEVNSLEFANGQGIVGAVMVSEAVTELEDASKSFDLSSPPDLFAYGLQSALCTPMIEDREVWGTLSVFDGKKREWTEDDKRVLATLGSQGVVAIRNTELFDSVKRSNWELTNLQEALQAATSTLDFNQVLRQLLDRAAKASEAQIGFMALDDSGQLIVKVPFGTDAKKAEKLARGMGRQILRSVMDTGQPVMETFAPKAGSDSSLSAVLCVPIALGGTRIGVVFLANEDADRAFTSDHRKLVTELAAQAALPIQNARQFEDAEESSFATLTTLASLSDARDKYTAGHSGRVAEYAKMIARQMKYSTDQAAWVRLELGARIHDIGKIGVPDAVLFKSGKLTDEEFDLMKAHTTIGFDSLRRLKNLTDELVIVRSHHERFDGKGYPDRKKGNELPIFLWIVSAADAIDAMTSDRPYRRGMSLDVAMDQVRQGAGTHFHPDVAEAVLDAAANGTLKLIEQKSLYADAPAVGAFENPVG